jgi:hypothetical protein
VPRETDGEAVGATGDAVGSGSKGADDWLGEGDGNWPRAASSRDVPQPEMGKMRPMSIAVIPAAEREYESNVQILMGAFRYKRDA